MSTEERDTERVSVRTYVPAYQREEWQREADEMGMSRAEYVRTMVQAGRREFSLDATPSQTEKPVRGASSGFEPGGDGLRKRILDVLEREGVCDWEQLVAGVTGELEDRIEETVDELQRENRVRYDGRRGGYTVMADGE